MEEIYFYPMTRHYFLSSRIQMMDMGKKVCDIKAKCL